MSDLENDWESNISNSCVYSCYIKWMTLVLNRSKTNFYIKGEFIDEVTVNWSVNLHLKILTLFQEFAEFNKNLQSFLQIVETVQEKKKKTKGNINVTFSGSCAVFLKISENHNMILSTNDMSVTETTTGLEIQTSLAKVSIDNCEVFTIEGLNLTPLQLSGRIEEERKNTEGFRLFWNDTWSLIINVLRMSFPYQHEFADAVQNELISIYKWLRIIHKKKKVPFTVDSPLPKDFIIQIREFLFEMSDDPFEVSLRDNYELLEDEYKESLRRQEKLSEKVQELCKTHLHLPAGKVEELYSNLSKKNAEIYIQRSKQLYGAEPSRTRLFAWCMNDVEIIAMADPSVHGTDNVIKTIKEIDPESPWPEENIEFSTLWCRSVTMSCKEWKFLLRDFPQPLLDIKNLQLWGKLAGAEQVAPRRVDDKQSDYESHKDPESEENVQDTEFETD